MKEHPNILRVETGMLPCNKSASSSSKDVLDYSIYYERAPAWLRRLGELLGLDIYLRDLYLAWQVKLIENQYDLIYACSEKAGIPLSFLRLRKPLIVVAHHMESPLKARFAHITGIAKKWSGIGYISNESKEFFIEYLGIPKDRLFQYESAKYLDIARLAGITSDGPIMSVGVAKRDYQTLITALSDLPDYETELFVSSKFGDTLKSSIKTAIPKWVRFAGFVSDDELIRRYQHTRFAIVSLEDTTHTGAGINVVLEAAAFEKAVIATRTGGMSTFVKHGETGILVPPHDVNAMKEAIQMLWTHPELARQMGLAGRRYIEKQFNPQDVNSRIYELLNKVYCDTVSKT